MDFLITTFNLILYQPLFNILVLLYNYLPGHDFGIATIILTFLIRLILYPSSLQSIRSQKIVAELQPKIQEIQEKYKDDKVGQAQATMELYQKEKFNPFSGCLPLLIQLPILIALYRVFWNGLQPEQLNLLYGFVSNPGKINPYFFGIVNLSSPNLLLAMLAGGLQFFQTKMITPVQKPLGKSNKKGQGMSQFSDMMQKQMLYFFPIFTFFILLRLPSAIGLYWVVTTAFSILQQYLIFRPRAVKQEHD